MADGAATATLLFLALVLAVHWTLAWLARRTVRGAGATLVTDHLVHWRYPPGAWQRHCGRQRRELWFGLLRPALRYLLPLLVLAGGIGLAAVLRAGIAPLLALLLAVLIFVLVANLLVGPLLRGYLALSRRCHLDYELYLGADGALEVWYDAAGVRATEVHPFTAGGSRVEGAEAHGVDPAVLVIRLVKPLAYGFQHSEECFLVPDGR
ncbi:MAG TPA: hypothetical protein VIX81_00840, partial [Gammaproteobacteria bacterium]